MSPTEAVSRIEGIADELAAEIYPPYSQCRLTVRAVKDYIEELRAIHTTLRAASGREPERREETT